MGKSCELCPSLHPIGKFYLKGSKARPGGWLRFCSQCSAHVYAENYPIEYFHGQRPVSAITDQQNGGSAPAAEFHLETRKNTE